MEDLLELAKEKIAQIKSDYTISNATVEKFPKHLSNITLSQEQIKEVEALRDIILYPCTQRIDSEKKNPGSLCDAFADYLVDKCKRFDNLLTSCFGGFLGQYETARNLQLSCTASPPLYNEKKIESCLTVGPLNHPTLIYRSYYLWGNSMLIHQGQKFNWMLGIQVCSFVLSSTDD